MCVRSLTHGNYPARIAGISLIIAFFIAFAPLFVFCSMKPCCQLGDQTHLDFVVGAADLAAFNNEMVHPFYATFALGRDVEWTCRQFVLKMKEADEEGIGSFLNIEHKSPALLGETVRITAEISRLEKNQIDCIFKVEVGDRLIAIGDQGQRILKKEKVAALIASIQSAK